MTEVRVVLPIHLRRLAGLGGETAVKVAEPVTLGAVLDAIEAAHPQLEGTIRDRMTRRRRPFVRYFASEQDFSHEQLDTALPETVVAGIEPLLIVGAMAGG